MIGQQIASYTIQSLIGEGGMSNVYLGIHHQLGRKVAIKVLHKHLSVNPHIRKRFQNEALALANLHHPNIVHLYDFIEMADGLYLVMEYVEGIELEKYIYTLSGAIPEKKAVTLFAQILDACIFAHQKGIIHRDLKPSNMMIANDIVKVLDFGIAKMISGDYEEQHHKLTQTGMRMGTVLYMSPEQIKGQVIDLQSDIYSLGVTLFEMLTGKCPYDSHCSEFDVSVKIVNEPLPRAKSFYPAVSDALQAVIDKATAKNPAQRFKNCEEFKNALLQAENSVMIPISSNISNIEINSFFDKVSDLKAFLQNMKPLLIVLSGVSLLLLMILFSMNYLKQRQIETQIQQQQETQKKILEMKRKQIELTQKKELDKLRNEVARMKQGEYQRKSYLKTHILEYVHSDCSKYSAVAAGGVYDLEILLRNDLEFIVEEVKVQVEFLEASSQTILKTQEVIFQNLMPRSSSAMVGLQSQQGTQVRCNVVGVSCKALE
jgi:serine/threonine protein kinase